MIAHVRAVSVAGACLVPWGCAEKECSVENGETPLDCGLGRDDGDRAFDDPGLGSHRPSVVPALTAVVTPSSGPAYTYAPTSVSGFLDKHEPGLTVMGSGFEIPALFFDLTGLGVGEYPVAVKGLGNSSVFIDRHTFSEPEHVFLATSGSLTISRWVDATDRYSWTDCEGPTWLADGFFDGEYSNALADTPNESVTLRLVGQFDDVIANIACSSEYR